MVSIVDDSSSACSVSARSERLRRSSQTAIGNPAKTSSTSTMVMKSLLATYSLMRSLKPFDRAGSAGPRGKRRACVHVGLAFDVLSIAIVPGPSAGEPLRPSPSCGLQDPRTAWLTEFTTSSRDAPCCKAGADERLRAREIVDQLESFAAGRGVGDDPVADFVRAVAGARKRLGEERGEPYVLAIGEVADAGVIELLVDPSHRWLADRVAQAAGAEHRDPQWLAVALDRLPQQPAPGEAAADARHRLLQIVDDKRHDGQLGIDRHAPERDAGAVVELEAMRQRGFEIAIKRGLQQVAAERDVAFEPLARKH